MRGDDQCFRRGSHGLQGRQKNNRLSENKELEFIIILRPEDGSCGSDEGWRDVSRRHG